MESEIIAEAAAAVRVWSRGPGRRWGVRGLLDAAEEECVLLLSLIECGK